MVEFRKKEEAESWLQAAAGLSFLVALGLLIFGLGWFSGRYMERDAERTPNEGMVIMRDGDEYFGKPAHFVYVELDDRRKAIAFVGDASTMRDEAP